MRERKWRNRRRDFLRRGERWRAAKINAVIEVQLPHDFQERRNRLQVSLLQRKQRNALVNRATWRRA
jgi:hypothetical protein